MPIWRLKEEECLSAQVELKGDEVESEGRIGPGWAAREEVGIRMRDIFIFKSSPNDIFSLLLEGEEGRGGNINVREKHQLVASHGTQTRDPTHLDQGSGTKPVT